MSRPGTLVLVLAVPFLHVEPVIVIQRQGTRLQHISITLVVMHASFPLGVLDYHTEDLLRREDFILSTRFARMDPTECFFVFRLEHKRRGMTDRWRCERTCFYAKLRSRSMVEYTSASVHSICTSTACLLIFLEDLLLW